MHNDDFWSFSSSWSDHDAVMAGVREEPIRGRAGEEGTRQEPQPF